jgi:hypothetical protein
MKPDRAQCSHCSRKFWVKDLETEKEGDWENGYYDIHVCPRCDDGGCIDVYYFSAKQEKRWLAWKKKNA